MSWSLRMMLTVSLIALPMALYVVSRLVASVGHIHSPWKSTARKTLYPIVIWVFALPTTILINALLKTSQRLFIFSSTQGWLDYILLYPFWIGIILIAELLFPFIALDLALLLTRFRGSWRKNATRAIPFIRLILGGILLIYVPVRVLSDTLIVHNAEVRIALPRLPAELRGIQLTLLADLQVDRYTDARKIVQVEKIVRTRQPEVLLSGGDMVTNGTEFLTAAGRAMCEMSGSVASVAVLGDHDQWSAPTTIRNLYQRCGWRFLENAHQIITIRGRTVLISGLTYIYSRRLSKAELDSFLSSAPTADVRILLTHQPAEMVVRQAAEHGYDLLVAGHTHGGQIVLHPLGIPLTPSMFETEFYQGEYRVGNLHVVVTRGVGLTLAPIRYHAPAEVTTVVLGE